MKTFSRNNYLLLLTLLTTCYFFCIPFLERNELLMGHYSIFGAILLLMGLAFITYKKTTVTFTGINFIDIAVAFWFFFNLCNQLVHPDYALSSSSFFYNITLFVFYVTIRILSVHETAKNWLFNGMIALIFLFSILQSAMFILQKFGILSMVKDQVIAVGTFPSMGSFAVFISFVFLIVVWYIAVGNKNSAISRWIQYASVFLFFLIIFVSPHTKSRTSWIIMIMGSMIILYFRYQHQVNQLFSRKWILFTILSAVIVISSIALYSMYRFKQDSADGRVVVWNTTLHKVPDNIWFGQGPDAFRLKYLDWQGEWFKARERSAKDQLLAGEVVRCYNDFLLELIERGALGLLFLLTLFYVALQNSFKSTKDQKSLFLAILLGMVFGSLVTFTISTPYVKLLFFLVLGFIANQTKPWKNARISRPVFVSIPLLLFSFLIAYAGIKEYKRVQNISQLTGLLMQYSASSDCESVAYQSDKNKELIESEPTLFIYSILCLYKQGEYQRCIDAIKKYNHLTADSRVYNLLGDCYKALKHYDLAENAYKTELSMIPNRFFPLYKLQKIYQLTGDTGKAVTTARIILAKPVKINSPAIEEMKVEMNKYTLRIDSIKNKNNHVPEE